MRKTTLVQLGKLCQEIDKTYNAFAKSHFEDEELKSKLSLLEKVKRNLEEQSRGFLKSKISYTKWSDYLLENYTKYPFKELVNNLLTIK